MALYMRNKKKENQDAVDKEIANQKAEWIKFAQQSQRDLGNKYNETAKTLIGLFSTVFAVFTVLLAFFGLPSQIKINIIVATLTIACFTFSIILLIFVIGPQRKCRKAVVYENSNDIMDITICRNRWDYRFLTSGIILFIVGILLIQYTIGISIFNPGDRVQIIVPDEKVPYLKNFSVPFENNSSISGEIRLIKQDDKTYSFQLENGDIVRIKTDWVQAINIKK